jgi:hypothetical protein
MLSIRGGLVGDGLANATVKGSVALRTSVAVPGGAAFLTSSFDNAKAPLRVVAAGAMAAGRWPKVI